MASHPPPPDTALVHLAPVGCGLPLGQCTCTCSHCHRSVAACGCWCGICTRILHLSCTCPQPFVITYEDEAGGLPPEPKLHR